MKCACPITTFRSSGLSTGTTSQESNGVVMYTCCHRNAREQTQKSPNLRDFGDFCVCSRRELEVLTQVRLGVNSTAGRRTLARDQRADVHDPLALLARNPGPVIGIRR